MTTKIFLIGNIRYKNAYRISQNLACQYLSMKLYRQFTSRKSYFRTLPLLFCYYVNNRIIFYFFGFRSERSVREKNERPFWFQIDHSSSEQSCDRSFSPNSQIQPSPVNASLTQFFFVNYNLFRVP